MEGVEEAWGTWQALFLLFESGVDLSERTVHVGLRTVEFTQLFVCLSDYKSAFR